MMMTKLAQHVQRPRVEGEREDEILDATVTLLMEVGYDRLTMDAVAARAKASKATLYRRWNGKVSLVIDALHAAKEPGSVPDTGSRLTMMLHYGGLDQRINAGIPAYEAALKAAGTKYELYVYEGANHAFNNDTSAERYNKPAADLAWQRTLAFFARWLR